MGDAKKIVLRPIDSKIANQFIERVHYSGKIVNNSNLHIGVFYGGTLHGAMQFGSPLDKRKVLPLVNGTQWHQMMELNRMAFDDTLPRNSKSTSCSRFKEYQIGQKKVGGQWQRGGSHSLKLR